MTDPVTRTLEVPGAVLTYDVREPATPTTEPTRGALGLAGRLGVEPVTFPGGHNGFLGGEYGQTGEPEGFARTLREVLAGTR